MSFIFQWISGIEVLGCSANTGLCVPALEGARRGSRNTAPSYGPVFHILHSASLLHLLRRSRGQRKKRWRWGLSSWKQNLRHKGPWDPPASEPPPSPFLLLLFLLLAGLISSPASKGPSLSFLSLPLTPSSAPQGPFCDASSLSILLYGCLWCSFNQIKICG